MLSDCRSCPGALAAAASVGSRNNPQSEFPSLLVHQHVSMELIFDFLNQCPLPSYLYVLCDGWMTPRHVNVPHVRCPLTLALLFGKAHDVAGASRRMNDCLGHGGERFKGLKKQGTHRAQGCQETGQMVFMARLPGCQARRARALLPWRWHPAAHSCPLPVCRCVPGTHLGTFLECSAPLCKPEETHLSATKKSMLVCSPCFSYFTGIKGNAWFL